MATSIRREGAPTSRKEPLTVAAGPYGHPFHPILVTIPIGAWVSSLVFDIAAYASGGSTALVDGAQWLIAIGLLGAIVAALFGLMDLLTIPRPSRALVVGMTHMTLNLCIVGLYVGNFFWRHDKLSGASHPGTGPLVLSAVAVGLLLISGWLGGMLAYRYGVRVAAEADQADGFRSAA
jgi:uncharacterized membrane protein